MVVDADEGPYGKVCVEEDCGFGDDGHGDVDLRRMAAVTLMVIVLVMVIVMVLLVMVLKWCSGRAARRICIVQTCIRINA